MWAWLLACLCACALAVEVPTYPPCDVSAETSSKKLLCYYEARAPAEQVDACRCTHVVYTRGARVGDDYTLHVDQDHERSSYILRQRNPSLRLVISVVGNATLTDALVKSTSRRREFVASVAKYVHQTKFDGVELDFEWSRQGGGAVKQGLVELVKSLRDKMDAPEEARSRQKRDYSVTEKLEDSSTTAWSMPKRNKTTGDKHGANRRRKAKVIERASNSRVVFLRIPINPEVIVKRFDLKTISKYVENFVVATNNMSDASEKGLTYHPSRLMGLADMLNMDSMMDLLTGLGAQASMLVISVPAVATRFTLDDVSKNTPRAPAQGAPVEIGQGELCALLAEGGWTVERDEDLTAPYAYRNNTWIAFDDNISAGIKGKYVLLRELGGAAVYQLDDEDYAGRCTNVSDGGVLAALHDSFTRLARRSRQALLQNLQQEIHESTLLTYSGDVHLSPYRIVRVVDLAGAVHVVRKDAKTEFECSRQGYFSHPLGCNRFYRCVKFNQYTPDYTVFEYDCPAGLAFDERYEVCVWPGSLPRGSPCTGSSEIAPVPRARYSCPPVEGYFADPENCRWFFACLDHGRDGSPLTAYEFRCPFGLVFDESKLLCDWPWSVEGGCGNSGKNVFVAQAGFGYSAGLHQGGFATIHQGAAFTDIHQGSGFVEQSATLHQSAAFADQSSVNIHQGAALVDHGSVNIHQGAAFVDQSSLNIHQGAAVVDQSSVNFHQGAAVVDHGSVNLHQGAAFVDQSSVNIHQGAAVVDHGSVNIHQGAAFVDHNQGAVLNHASVDYSDYGARTRYSGESHAQVSSQEGGYFSGESAGSAERGYSSASHESYDSGSHEAYYAGRHSASYASYPDSLVSGGRIQNSGGVILGDFVAKTVAPPLPGVTVTSYQRGENLHVGNIQGVSLHTPDDYQSTPIPFIAHTTAASYVAHSSPVPRDFVAYEPKPEVSFSHVVKQPQLFYSQSTPVTIQQDYKSSAESLEVVQKPAVSFAHSTVQQPQRYYVKSTPQPILQDVVVKQASPAVFYQSTPRPIVKQEYVQPIVKQEYVQPIVQQEYVQPIVQQEYVQPIVQQKYVQPIVKQEYVQPIVHQDYVQPIVQQEYVQPIVKQEYVQPIVKQEFVQPIVQKEYIQPIVKQEYVQPIVKQEYVQPIVQQEYVQPIVKQQPTVFYQSTPRPIVKQEVVYEQPIVEQKQVVHKPTVYYQSTPQPIVQQVSYQQPIVQKQIVQQPTVYYQSTPQPIQKQEIHYEQPIVQKQIVQQPTVYYQSTPQPIQRQEIHYEQPIVEKQIVQQPTVFYKSTPQPIQKQEIHYEQPIVQKQVVQQPTVYYQSTPQPILKQQVSYQQPIVQKQIVQQPATVFYQSTPQPIQKQEIHYEQPIVQKQIVQQPTVYYQSTPQPIQKQEIQYEQPIVQKQIVQQPTVYYKSTPQPIQKQEIHYEQPIVQKQQPTVYYKSTPQPEVTYQQPIVQKQIVQQPTTYFTPSTPQPVYTQKRPLEQRFFFKETTPRPIVPQQVSYRPSYQQVAVTTPAPVTSDFVSTQQVDYDYNYSAGVSDATAASVVKSTRPFVNVYQSNRQLDVSVNGEYGQIQQGYREEVTTQQAVVEAPRTTAATLVSTAADYGSYEDSRQDYVQPAGQQVFTSYDSRYGGGMASFVNQGIRDMGYRSEEVDQGYEEVDQGYKEVDQGYKTVDQGYKEEQRYQQVEQDYKEVEQRYQEESGEEVTNKPTTVFEQYHRETSPGRGYSTTTQSPSSYDYLPKLSTSVLEATTFRPRPKAGRKLRVRVQDPNVVSLLDQYSGGYGAAKNAFVDDVIAQDLSRVSSTTEQVEVTTFRPRQKAARKRPTTTTERYEDDDEEDVKLKQPIVVVTQLSDANPILVAKLGAKCTCQSGRVSLRKKSRGRGEVPAVAYAAEVPASDDDIAVVAIRPPKRPTVTRVPVDTTIADIVSSTRRPHEDIADEPLPNIPDLERRYVKSGLRNPTHPYRRPKIPVTPAQGEDVDYPVVETSKIQPIVVEDPSSDPAVATYNTPYTGSSSNSEADNTPHRRPSNSPSDSDNFPPKENPRRRPYDALDDASRTRTEPRRRPAGGYDDAARPSSRRPAGGYDDAVDARPSGRRPAGGYDDAVDARPSSRRPEDSADRRRLRPSNDADQGATKIAGRSFDRYGPGGWRSVDETLQGSVDCQRPGLFRHPKYCNKFYACHWDNWKARYTLHVFNCPVHLAFDKSLGACNWPTKGPACADDNLLL